MWLWRNIVCVAAWSIITTAYTLKGGSAATLIGSTGVIGSSILCKLIAADQCNCYASHLDSEADTVKALSILSKDKFYKTTFFTLDYKGQAGDQQFVMARAPVKGAEHQHHILINAAGVCLQGNTLQNMEDSLKVNCIGPLAFAQSFVTEFMANTLADSNKREACIINISSGEGELCQLNSGISKRLLQIQSTSDLHEFSNDLVRSFDPTFEYAHGDSPMYSLSKAILNRGTLLLHEQCQKLYPGRVRVLACCPGNVASPMTTAEELRTAIPAGEAADHILELVTRPDVYPGGQFYRHGMPIPW